MTVYTKLTNKFTRTSLGGRITDTLLDAVGRPTKIDVQMGTSEGTAADLADVDFTYNAGTPALAKGQLEKVTLTAVGATPRVYTLGYDTAGNLTTITNPLSQTVTLTPDGATRIVTQTLPDTPDAQAPARSDHHGVHHDYAQMRGALDHAPTVAARTDPASLARQRHQSFVRAAFTAKTRKAAREHAATEEAPHAALDECGQRRAACARRHALEEGLEIVAQDAVQHRGLGVTRLVAVGTRRRQSATTDRMRRERICSGRWQHAERSRTPHAIRIRAESPGQTARAGGGRHGGGWRPPVVQTGHMGNKTDRAHGGHWRAPGGLPVPWKENACDG